MEAKPAERLCRAMLNAHELSSKVILIIKNLINNHDHDHATVAHRRCVVSLVYVRLNVVCLQFAVKEVVAEEEETIKNTTIAEKTADVGQHVGISAPHANCTAQKYFGGSMQFGRQLYFHATFTQL